MLGEGTKRLSAEFGGLQPDIPWREAAGTRDVLVHDYDEVDLARIWTTATRHVPALLGQVEPLLPPEDLVP